jgi:hypothetical protein
MAETKEKGRRLAKSVVAMDPDTGEFKNFLAGTIPPESVADNITNPAAWESSSKGGTSHPNGGLSVMEDEEIFAAANSNSSRGSEEDEDDLNTVKATGDFDEEAEYAKQTIPQLRAQAAERGIDTTGMSRKQELIDALVEDDAS